jgi:hypothetical protein
MANVKLPPGCGVLLQEPLYYNEFQQRFQRARRMRFCLNCKTTGQMDEMGHFECANCHVVHDGRWGNLTAPRCFDHFLLLAGRGGGKTLVGAHAVREELMIPGAQWWVMGANHKWLWDSTFPTLVGLLHPSWIKRWDPEHVEITLMNDAKVAFRSLEDPERARGPHGVAGMWFDEAAQCPERAYHVGMPMLIKAAGIVLATTTVLGYDWTYEQLEQHALVYKTPGYWTAKWWTEHNPMFAANPMMKRRIENDRKTMVPELFAQEYRAERSNAQGLVYGALIHKNVLKDDEEIKQYIPEWPSISPSRKVLIGLDEGGDHPFGAVLIVKTDRALVVIRDYLERMKAHSAAHDDIHMKLGLWNFNDRTYAGNKNALNLRLEWGLKGTGVGMAENRHEIGIQRVQSWLLTGQLKFAYTAQRTIHQMAAYRYADNTKPSTGEKKDKESVFKLKDELPDGVRYALMLFPELPDPDMAPMSDAELKRLAAFDDKTRRDLELAKEFADARKKGSVLTEKDPNYPMGDFFGHGEDGGVATDFTVMWNQ